MPLPMVDEIRAMRQLHADASKAHQFVHHLNELLAGSPHWDGSTFYGAEDLVDFDQRWGAMTTDDHPGMPPVDDPPTLARHIERLEAARDLLLPLAKREHHLHHELEHKLYDQYQALQNDPDHAEVRAILDPLYEERAALFEALKPAYNQRGQVEAAIGVLDQWLETLTTAFADHADDPHGHRVRATHGWIVTTVDLVRGTLVPMGLSDDFEGKVTLDLSATDVPAEAVLEEVERVHGQLLTYRAAQDAAYKALDDEVNRQHRRWDEIEAALHRHTG